MVIEKEIRSYLDWLIPTGEADWYRGALFQYSLTFLVYALLALLVGYLVLLVRYGPAKAGDLLYRTFTGGVRDLTQISPRRVMALAWLAIKESFWRQSIVALVIYGLILSFASWFLQVSHQDPAKVQLDFVLSWTMFLMLLQGLLLSAFSLPNEFTSKTIYTVVTKPVRSCDIVLGRMLGFTVVGTVMLAIMCLCSYLFVTRSLSHTHTVERSALEGTVGADGGIAEYNGITSHEHDHRHELTLDPDYNGQARSTYGHRHIATADGDEIVISDAVDVMRARVPKRGELYFLNREGVEVEKGVSVGAEWTYRSFVAGGTNASAVWTFDNITAESLEETADGASFLPIELVVRVFRTHKGDIEQAIRGKIHLQNPDKPEIKSSVLIFPAKDMSINTFEFPEQLTSEVDQKPLSLMDDLVSNGRVEIVVQCVDGGQYFGFARADCYIRLPEGDPLWNFVKAHLGIWVQMVVVIAIGVTASTFLNGPIASLLTTSFILLGFYRDDFVEIATGKAYGGGPVEAFVRLITQMNLTSPFSNEAGLPIRLMKSVDQGLESIMQAVATLLPDFPSLSSAGYVAQGYDIPDAVLGRQLTLALAYVIGLSIAGYFFLRSREVAK